MFWLHRWYAYPLRHGKIIGFLIRLMQVNFLANIQATWMHHFSPHLRAGTQFWKMVEQIKLLPLNLMGSFCFVNG